MTMFDLVLPGAAEPESSDATYRYVGDPQLLGLILANPSAGRIIES